jgi:hypothetical protein
MKSAEEWMESKEVWYRSPRFSIGDIYAIQADALRSAAEICQRQAATSPAFKICNPDFNEAVGKCVNAILADADELTQQEKQNDT